MTFDESLAYMQGLIRFGIKLGNERFEALMARLGDPQSNYSIAHVAGTKGKGSTTAMIASILQAHGLKVGAYYSPYVYDVRERIQVNTEMISRDDFARLVTKIFPKIEAVKSAGLGETTEFELKTAVGLSYFAEQHVDAAAIEVGIGGRLDATNIVCPEVSIITNIGLDHTHILGDTHAKIAAEKAGIIKPGIPVITAVDEHSAYEVIRQTALSAGAPLWLVREGRCLSDSMSGPSVTWSVHHDTFEVRTAYGEYTELRTGMPGAYQIKNAACAIAASEVILRKHGLLPTTDLVREALMTAYLPGRTEIVQANPMVILDGAHNELAARALAEEIKRMPHKRLILVVGMVGGHSPEGVLSALAPLADQIIVTQPSWHRRLPAEEVADAARQFNERVTVEMSPVEAARRAVELAGQDDLVLITGSFYLIGDIPREMFGG